MEPSAGEHGLPRFGVGGAPLLLHSDMHGLMCSNWGFVGLYRTSVLGPCSEASASHPSDSHKDRWTQMKGRWLVHCWRGGHHLSKGPWGLRTQPFPAAVSLLDVGTRSLLPSSQVLSHSGEWGDAERLHQSEPGCWLVW